MLIRKETLHRPSQGCLAGAGLADMATLAKKVNLPKQVAAASLEEDAMKS